VVPQPEVTAPQNAAQKLRAAKDARAAARKQRVIPAPKATEGVEVGAAETATLPPSLQQPVQESVGSQVGEDTGQGGLGPQRPAETGVANTTVVAPAVPVPVAVAESVVAVETKPEVAAAPVQAAPVPAVAPPEVPVSEVVVYRPEVGPRLPSYEQLAPATPTMPKVLQAAFTRQFETELMSLRSTYDRVIGKQEGLNSTVEQARAMGFPEDEIQRLAAMYRWVIPKPSADEGPQG